MGGKYVRMLEKQLSELRRRDHEHGNRQLFLDDVFVTYLLAFFNPTIRSLRTIEDFSQTRQVQRHLSINKLCRATLADFHRLVDPARLEPILAALRAQLSRKRAGLSRQPGSLEDLLRQAVAVDGTFLEAAAEVAWAVRGDNQQGRGCWNVRLDVHVAVESQIPEQLISAPGTSESASAAAHIQAGRIYLYDRGFSGFELINAHYQTDAQEPTPRAHFVMRYKPAGGNAPILVEAEERPLTAQDQATGVVSDRIGRFRSSKPCRHRLLDVPLREVLVEYVDEHGASQSLRLITNLLDVPANIVAQLYRSRWQIELFFRWLKCFADFEHLISHSRAGVLLHFYTAVIGALLMYLHSGCRPSKYTFVLLGQVACGAATWEEILPILQERERQRDVARRSAAARRAKKQSS
ncbi:MAG TPA: IS4 family transposase [Pirellulaceae bacterium]|nr:IS4 family transposase [Pirellulaceae bacterium]